MIVCAVLAVTVVALSVALLKGRDLRREAIRACLQRTLKQSMILSRISIF